MHLRYTLYLLLVSVICIGNCLLPENVTVIVDTEDFSTLLSDNVTVIVNTEDKTTVSLPDNVTVVLKTESIAVSDNVTVALKTESTAVSDKVTVALKTESTAILDNVEGSTEATTTVQAPTFKEAEKEILDFVNNLLKQLLPKVVGGSGAAELSPRCIAGMMKIFGNVRRLKGWTIKMIDSLGKTTPGILMGTSYTLGNYDECLDLSISYKGEETTEASKEMFRGKYCRIKIQLRKALVDTAEEYHSGLRNATDLRKLKEVIQFIPYIPIDLPYLTHFTGLCFPSTCSNKDINYLAGLVPFPGSASLDRCEVKTETEVESNQLIIICIFFFLFLLACLSTCLDWWSHSGNNKPTVDDHDKRCVSVSIAFSFCNNTKRLMKNIEEDSDGLLSGKCVRGICVVAVVWVIVGTTYFFPSKAFYIQAINLRNLHTYWDEAYFTIIQGYPLALDALLVCYGFIQTYSLWYSTSKSQKVRVNIIGLIIKDYIRLCIPLGFCYGIIFLLPLLGSGPFWNDLLGNTLDRCRNSVWHSFGMYANFLELKDQCLPHLWFVSCLSQLTLVGIILCWILSKRMKLGILIIILLCAGCNAAVGILTYSNNLPPSFVPYFANGSQSLFFELNISWPLSHFGPFAIGMLTGILIARREQHRSRMCLGAIGWIAFLVVLFFMFSVLYSSRDNSLDSYWSAVYAGLHRTVFGACVAWIIIAGVFGVGGFVNRILSWRVFDPLYKLSYYAFIFQFIVIGYFIGISRTHMPYSHTELASKVTFYTAASYVTAYFFFMLLEMPLSSLRSVLCPRKTQQIEVTPLNNFKIPTVDIISKNTIEGNCKLWSISETHFGELKG